MSSTASPQSPALPVIYSLAFCQIYAVFLTVSRNSRRRGNIFSLSYLNLNPLISNIGEPSRSQEKGPRTRQIEQKLSGNLFFKMQFIMSSTASPQSPAPPVIYALAFSQIYGVFRAWSRNCRHCGAKFFTQLFKSESCDFKHLGYIIFSRKKVTHNTN